MEIPRQRRLACECSAGVHRLVAEWHEVVDRWALSAGRGHAS
jgi:hypothetical protein